VLVMKDYFNGASATAAYDVRPVTRTVLSIPTGIAIDQGLIRSVNETVGDYPAPVVPSLTPDKAAITVRQLLQGATMGGSANGRRGMRRPGPWGETSPAT
jgi:hypothetical protein